MKYGIALLLINLFCLAALCQNGDAKNLYTVPDSIQASGFYAEIKITDSSNLRKGFAGAGANKAGLHFGYDGKDKVIKFLVFAAQNKEKASGLDVYPHLTGHAWKYNWKPNTTYPLLVTTASDSASNSTLCSGYIFLPEEKKWKLIATRIFKDTMPVKYAWPSTSGNLAIAVTCSNRWLQRSNGSWKALDMQTTKAPSLRQMSNIDSLLQQQTEEALLRAKLKDSAVYEEGMFYQTLRKGTGRLVKVTDTLTVHYRGSLYSDGSVFDETKDKPATFPLERLIKGWQIGLLHCKVGGKMRLYLPSGSAYGIRTRSAEIPPNSILVFDVEVLDAKEKVIK